MFEQESISEMGLELPLENGVYFLWVKVDRYIGPVVVKNNTFYVWYNGATENGPYGLVSFSESNTYEANKIKAFLQYMTEIDKVFQTKEEQSEFVQQTMAAFNTPFDCGPFVM